VELRSFGRTGVKVSSLCLGCMMFGGRTDPADSYAIIDRGLDAGINFLDTANVYSLGRSEEATGEALKRNGMRHQVVLATKVHGRMRPGPNGAGLSRRAIMAEIDNSLRRLGTDHVDLYQIHRWDDGTPIAETMEALHDVVKAGKARALAINLERRSSHLPDVPTYKEAGMEIPLVTTFGLYAPARTPKDIIQRVNLELANGLINNLEMRRKFITAAGVEIEPPAGGSPEEFAAYLLAERERWASIVKTANIKRE